MNRLIRMILYIAAGCVGIGFAALILSVVLSGGHLDWEDGMIGRAKEKAQDLAVRAKREIPEQRMDDEYEYAQDDMDAFDSDSDDAMGLLAIDGSAIQDLSIDLQHGYLCIEESDDSRIQVMAAGQTENILANCESGAITIKDNRKGKSRRKDAMVYVSIPEQFQFQNVTIRIKAGEIETDCGFGADQMTVSAEAGRISLYTITADTFTGTVGAGEMVIENSILHTVRLDCGVGRIDIEADISGDAQIDCGMGEISMELAKGADSVNYKLECGVGSIEIGDNSYTGLSRAKRIENGGTAEFALNCGMGVISID